MLLHSDHIMLAVLLAQIKLHRVDNDLITDDIDFLLKSGDVINTTSGAASLDGPGSSFLSLE